jgi:hypothetical protein
MQGEMMDDLDAVLEAGLASYAQAETQLGFEERILRRVLVQERPRAFLWWPWMAAAFAALIVAVAWFSGMHRSTAPPVAIAITAPPTNATPIEDREVRQGGIVPASPAGRMAMSASKERRAPREKQAQDVISAADSMDFISIVPITAEEQRIVLAVQHHPAEVSRAMREASMQSSEPIHIAAIQVDKLQSGNQKEEE